MQLYGLIIGIIIGYGISNIVVYILQGIIKNAGETIFFEANNTVFSMKFPIQLIILIALIVYIIVSISVLLPLRKVKRNHIIIGIRGKNKLKKTSRIQSIFSEEVSLAYKYTKREKTRNLSIVLSITVSVFIFLVINGIIINFIKNANRLTFDDYLLRVDIDNTQEIIKYLEGKELIQGYFVQTNALQKSSITNSSYQELFTEIPKEKIADDMAEIIEANKNLGITGTIIYEGSENIKYTEGTYKFEIVPYYLSENAYNEVLKKAGISELKENECILLNSQKIEDSSYGNVFKLTKYESGDSIKIRAIGRNQEKELCLNIASVVDDFEPYVPHNYQLTDYNKAVAVLLSKDMYEKELEQNTISTSEIFISTDKPYEIDGKLEEINEKVGGASGENLYVERLEEESHKALVKFILYTLDIIITVFCMANIYYIISESTTFRKKDFAILRSIGMSEKKIDKMLALEGIFYGISGIVLGTVFSLGVLNILKQFAIDTDLYLFNLPIMQIIYAIIIVYGVIFIAMLSARRKIKNRNIIDDVKMDIV